MGLVRWQRSTLHCSADGRILTRPFHFPVVQLLLRHRASICWSFLLDWAAGFETKQGEEFSFINSASYGNWRFSTLRDLLRERETKPNASNKCNAAEKRLCLKSAA
ncbi:hypothetical protein [Roseobacter weihaiensis]|uniref:hypothetical protein n=1 Tax=Roseobacter weihaiensis TaxID=2763262 RepID=UPI001D0B22EE|nr:hypothetical protein [Roseobacter sp. H9]